MEIRAGILMRSNWIELVCLCLAVFHKSAPKHQQLKERNCQLKMEANLNFSALFTREWQFCSTLTDTERLNKVGTPSASTWYIFSVRRVKKSVDSVIVKKIPKHVTAILD